MAKTKLDRFSVTLDRILKACGMQARLQEYRVQSRWDRTVGPAIARHARPTGLRSGKLQVIVDSPTWMQQLSLMKPEIIGKLNAFQGGHAVRDITLKLGEIEAPDGPAPAEETFEVSLTEEEREKIEQHVRTIEDDATREALRSLLERDVVSRKKSAK